ncbi:MAG: LCP family protein [Clostridiales bacterium]|nr:LCP family protein [Clostridiales bacterium]
MAVVLVLVVVLGIRTLVQGTWRQTYEDPGDGGDENIVQAATEPETETESEEESESDTESEADVEKWQEGVIEYNGKQYRYNSGIRSYLIMGIDDDDTVSEDVADYVSGGQSDAMFLLVADSRNEQLSVISINRNTMTEINIYDENGESLGTMEAQICLQHGFGDGRKISCNWSVNAVSKLFGNIPISGYVALNMGGISLLNNAVGGVEVEVMTDIKNTSLGVDLHEGDVVTLSGEEAYCYLRGRDTSEFDSATERLRRQEQYILSFWEKLMSMSDDAAEMATSVYDSVADYMVSSVDFTSLIEELSAYDFTEDRMYTVPGETEMGETYEEYYVDEDALTDLIMNVFYTEVSE